MTVLLCVRQPDDMGIMGYRIVVRLVVSEHKPIDVIKRQQYWLLGKDSVVRYSL